MRIPDSVLEHRVDLIPRLEVGTSHGASFGAVRADRPALVVDAEELVVDGRAASGTYGQQITSSARILLQPEDYVPPGSKVVLHKGTPAERTRFVVRTAYLEHTIAPSQAQAWLV